MIGPTVAAAPCVICGTTGGFMSANSHRASRTSLVKYGVPGVGCVSCYYAVRYRVAHGLDAATGEKLPPRRTPA